jgi:hypothetical protein
VSTHNSVTDKEKKKERKKNSSTPTDSLLNFCSIDLITFIVKINMLDQ